MDREPGWRQVDSFFGRFRARGGCLLLDGEVGDQSLVLFLTIFNYSSVKI